IDMIRVDASHFTPQSRPRLFIIAKQRDSVETLSCPATLRSPLRPLAISSTMESLPGIPWFCSTNSTLPCRRMTLDSILDDLPMGSKLWWEGTRRERFVNQIHPRHMPRLRECVK